MGTMCPCIVVVSVRQRRSRLEVWRKLRRDGAGGGAQVGAQLPLEGGVEAGGGLDTGCGPVWHRVASRVIVGSGRWRPVAQPGITAQVRRRAVMAPGQALT